MSEELFKLQNEIKECSEHLNDLLDKYFKIQNKIDKFQQILDIVNSYSDNKIEEIKTLINDETEAPSEKVKIIKRFVGVESKFKCSKSYLIDFIRLLSITDKIEIIKKHLDLLESYENKSVKQNLINDSNINNLVAKIIVSRGACSQHTIYQILYLIGNGDISKLNNVYTKPHINFKKIPDNFKSLMYYFDVYFKISKQIDIDVLEWLYDHNYEVELNELMLQLI